MHFASAIVAAGVLKSCLSAPLTSRDSSCDTVICGARGYDKDQGNLFYDDSGKDANYNACYAQCVASDECLSFAYGGVECITFNITLVDNFTPVEDSKYTFFDRACADGANSKRSGSLTTSTAACSTADSVVSSGASTVTSAPATTASATATSSTVSIPASCTNIAPQVTITSFEWFNSTHNLDCANPNYPSDSQVCWNGDTNELCNSGEANCTCTPFCYTGLPPVAYQPRGFGPPDTISVGIDGQGTTCSAANAQSIRNFEIGEGHFDCGSAADIMGFYGDSNPGQNKTTTLYYNQYFNYCGSVVPRYTGAFEISCSYDAGNNATCTIADPVVLPLTGWV